MSDFGVFAQMSSSATSEEVISKLNQVLAFEQEKRELQDEVAFATQQDADMIWVLITGYLVFFMHAGFSMLEVGSVRHKNAVNIMFKNVVTVAIGGIAYFFLGFAFAYGTDNEGKGSFPFIGVGGYANSELGRDESHFWFFQYAFAATGATIVSGAIAGRVQLSGYFFVAAWMVGLVYPVVSHWIWATGGWISAFTDQEDVLFGPKGCGMLDFAGSGVVHMTGGVAAFWGAMIAGPRIGRFVVPPENQNKELNAFQKMLVKFHFRQPYSKNMSIPPHNMALITLGTMILWFGWYGFNTGSTLVFDGPNAGKAAVTTTLSPSAAVVTAVILSRITMGYYDLGFALNCALAGLVAITAGCVVVEDWASVVIGAISAFVYFGASKLMVRIGLDDPVDAVAVHGFNGLWGVMASGIFGTKELIGLAYGGRDCPNVGVNIVTQAVGAVSIFLWVTVTTVPLFLLLQRLKMWRVPVEAEIRGLDHSEHGGQQAFIGNDRETELGTEEAQELLLGPAFSKTPDRVAEEKEIVPAPKKSADEKDDEEPLSA